MTCGCGRISPISNLDLVLLMILTAMMLCLGRNEARELHALDAIEDGSRVSPACCLACEMMGPGTAPSLLPLLNQSVSQALSFPFFYSSRSFDSDLVE